VPGITRSTTLLLLLLLLLLLGALLLPPPVPLPPLLLLELLPLAAEARPMTSAWSRLVATNRHRCSRSSAVA
jgi:hypothetical protein